MCFNKKKSKTIEPIQTLVSTPSHISQVQKSKELETTIDEVIKQLNNHFEFKIKTDEKCLINIYDIVNFTMNKISSEGQIRAVGKK